MENAQPSAAERVPSPASPGSLPLPPFDLAVTADDRRLAYVLTDSRREDELLRAAQYIRQYVDACMAGSGALTWSAEKPAAGWWWWERGDERTIVRVYRRSIHGELRVDMEHRWWDDPIVSERGGRWAGPLPEPLEPSSAEPLPNDQAPRPR